MTSLDQTFGKRDSQTVAFQTVAFAAGVLGHVESRIEKSSDRNAETKDRRKNRRFDFGQDVKCRAKCRIN